MKKLLLTLVSATLVVSSSATVVACDKKSGPDLYSSTTFTQKMASLQQLSSDLLLNNGVNFSVDYTKDIIDDFVQSIKESGDVPEKLLNSLKTNMMLILICNDFLYQVGKIPGYHWIIEKLRYQGTNFPLYSGVDASYWKFDNAQDIFSRFIGQWMDLNEWGISVTFFDEEIKPWHGGGTLPAFARINVNQKITTQGGVIQMTNSNGDTLTNPNGLHYDPSGNLYHIYPGIEDDNYIYQGWTTGSNLLDLKNIVNDKTVDTLQMDFLSYTPSAIDLVNNQLSDATMNDIIADFSDEIKKDFMDGILKNPIYLTDRDKLNSVVTARISNMMFYPIFKVMLSRRDMTDVRWAKIYAQLSDLEDDEMRIQVITRFSDALWDDVKLYIDQALPVAQKIANQDVLNAIVVLNDGYKNDYDNSTKENPYMTVDKMNELEDALKEVVKIMTPYLSLDYEELELCQSHIFLTAPFFFKKSQNQISEVNQLSSSQVDATNFGNNSIYQLGVLAVGSANDLQNIDQADFWAKYKNNIFILSGENTDLAFRNVSIRQRIKRSGGLFLNYWSAKNSNATWLPDHETLTGASPLNVGDIKNAASQSGQGDIWAEEMKNPANGADWFDNGTGFLKRLGISSYRDLTLSKLGQLFDASIRYVVRSIFTFDVTKQTMPIWNIPSSNGATTHVSSDEDLSGNIQGGKKSYDQNNLTATDDDIAFSDIAGLNSKNGALNPLYATEFNSHDQNQLKSDFRSKVQKWGLNDLFSNQNGINPVQYNIVIANDINTFGNGYGDPISYSQLLNNYSLLSNSISLPTYVQFSLREDVNNQGPHYDAYTDALRRFWDYWIRTNPDKAGNGYNENATNIIDHGTNPNFKK